MSVAADYLGTLADAVRDDERDERALLLDTTARLLRDSDSVRRFRTARAQPGAADGTVWERLCALGVTGACVPARAGGSGLSPAIGVMLAELFGRHLAPEPYVAGAFAPAVLLAAGENARADALLAATARGEARPVLALQERPGDELDRPQATVAQGAAGWVLEGRKRFVHAAVPATHFLVSARLGEGACLLIVAREAQGVSVAPRLLMDGTQAADVVFRNVRVDRGDVIVQDNRFAAVIERGMSWVHVAVSAELFGLASALLGMTVDYLRTRTQFDRPIGAFQALQHRAADLYCAKEIARFVIAEAATALAQGAPQPAVIASRCKARAAAAAVQIAREAVQLHGAVGFSDEADVGLYMNRIMVLAGWLGGADQQRRRYARLNPYRVN